jgi:Spy/CpxP family protein refolding chaperone
MFRLSVAASCAVVAIALLVTDRGLSQGDKKDPAPKAKGQLPTYWKNLGLTDDQKQKVYATRASYGGKIEALTQQVKELKSKEKADLEKILTDDQKAALLRLLLEKAPKATAPDAKKTDTKKP